jgi:nucleotide-binding universal stress UspA family protein
MMIPQIKKILYATDLSKNSTYAYQYAMNMAEKYNAEIVILHVIEPIPPMVKHYVKGFVDEIHWEEKIKYEQEMAIERIKKRLEDFCKQKTQDASQCLELASTILVRPGHPVEEILKAADEEQCSLIVLGTHGKGFLKQTFLGSVARSILDRAKKPVFIIPLPHEEPGVTIGDI